MKEAAESYSVINVPKYQELKTIRKRSLERSCESGVGALAFMILVAFHMFKNEEF